MSPISATWRIGAAAVAAALLLVLIVNAITQPVASKQRTYTADFTDISGLRTGADVRVHGVRVGKVESLELHRDDDRSVVQVSFTLDDRFNIDTESKLAIKYQSLTGLRYLDVLKATTNGAKSGVTVTHIPTTMTQPSFDITKLFNGLQPVLETLSPEDLNTFSANVETFLSGDGEGLGAVLDSIHTLTRFLSDRQQVVAVLLGNLRNMSDALGGRAKDFIQIVDWVNRPIDAALNVLDEFRKSDVYGPAFTGAVVQLLDSAGLKTDIDIDSALDKAFTNVDDFVSAFKLVPAMWDNIPPPAQSGHPLECSRGRAELPLPVDVLLNGQKVVLCKP
ncbi:MlaD family protein [Mycolicibacterium peregrinum]|uniref:MlaD family protein n=1 Tax=Mycolicibacterium TaxID=1866885 RepID=UPI003AAEF7F3